MRAVVQRVLGARVQVEGTVVGAIDRGLLAYLGFGRTDGPEDGQWVLAKIAGLRVFEDEHGKMARDVAAIGGALLLVSQFTLYGDVRRGRRPSFDEAMAPGAAEDAYEEFLRNARATGIRIAAGQFRAKMQVESTNDGPVTLWIDSAARAVRASG